MRGEKIRLLSLSCIFASVDKKIWKSNRTIYVLVRFAFLGYRLLFQFSNRNKQLLFYYNIIIWHCKLLHGPITSIITPLILLGITPKAFGQHHGDDILTITIVRVYAKLTGIPTINQGHPHIFVCYKNPRESLTIGIFDPHRGFIAKLPGMRTHSLRMPHCAAVSEGSPVNSNHCSGIQCLVLGQV